MKITDINTALQAYNQIDDIRDKLRIAYDAKEKRLKESQEQVELYLLETMKQMGLTAFESPGQGLAKIVTKRRFGCGDWSLFWSWLVENNRPDMLQKRLLDSAVTVYLETAGELPPAVNSEAKLSINVSKRPK